jgi:hypothetical protein
MKEHNNCVIRHSRLHTAATPLAFSANPTVVLTPLRGHLHVVEDNLYLKENSIVYVGEARVAQLTPPRMPVMALVRRSSLLPGMPDAFDRAPLR